MPTCSAPEQLILSDPTHALSGRCALRLAEAARGRSRAAQRTVGLLALLGWAALANVLMVGCTRPVSAPPAELGVPPTVAEELVGAAGEARGTLVAQLAAFESAPSAAGLDQLRHSDGGAFEDWRLMVIAEHSEDLGERERTYLALTERMPESFLAPQARHAAARLALARGDRAAAWHQLEPLASAGAPPPPAESLALAWQAAGAPEQQLALGVTIAEHAPEQLAGLNLAIDTGRASPALKAAWAVAAAPVLAGQRRAVEARALLATVPPADRSLAWQLALARVEVRSGRPLAAVALLENLEPTVPLDLARVRRLRATALLSLARAEPRLAVPRRAAALVELERVSRSGPAAEAIGATLELLDLLEEKARLLDAVARLADLAPDHRSGPRTLLRLALEATERGDSAENLALWQTLLDHPASDPWRPTALYWSARALEDLGHLSAARRRFGEAAYAAGFYRTMVRRRGDVEVAVTRSPDAAVPTDPALGRAEELARAGAHALALREVAGATADEAARAFLRAQILAGDGHFREAAMAVRPAFPALGPGLLEAVPSVGLRLYYPIRHTDEIVAWSTTRRLEPALIAGMIRQESAFDATAVSHAGARGLLQLMLPTAREIAGRERLPRPGAQDLHQPELSLRLGTAYFAWCLEMFDGEVELALAGYNAGPYRVRGWRRAQPRVPLDLFIETMPLSEPRDYVKRVLLHRDAYAALVPDLAGAA